MFVRTTRHYTVKNQPKIPHKNHNTGYIESPVSPLQGFLIRVHKPASNSFPSAAIAGNRAGYEALRLHVSIAPKIRHPQTYNII